MIKSVNKKTKYFLCLFAIMALLSSCEVNSTDTVKPIFSGYEFGQLVNVESYSEFDIKSEMDLIDDIDGTTKDYTVDCIFNKAPAIFSTLTDGRYTCTYKGKDKAGNNAADVIVYFDVSDTIAPVFHGVEDITVNLLSEFNVRDGVSVTDNKPGMDMSRVSITYKEPILNLKRIGNYEVVYSTMDTSGNSAEVTRKISVVNAVPVPLTTPVTDDLKLIAPYAGKEFVNDGIGKVNLYQCIDGDTAHFNSGSTRVNLRFLAINTPESTARYEPWGKEASNFTCGKLTNATEIVLTRDAEVMDSNGRYLGYVWYKSTANSDFRLLNLELVEQAYTHAYMSVGSLYYSSFVTAYSNSSPTLRRVFGTDKDPNFDYSIEGEEVTIKDLHDRKETFIGKKVRLTAVVAVKSSQNAYLVSQEDGEEPYGIYLYCGYTLSPDLVVGRRVYIGGLVVADYSGTLQLTNYDWKNVQIVDDGHEDYITPVELTADKLGERYESMLVSVKGLTVTALYIPSNTADTSFTVTANDGLGRVVTVRYDKATLPIIPQNTFRVGDKFDVSGPLAEYTTGSNTSYQIMLLNISKVQFKN